MKKENKWGRLSPMLRDATRERMSKTILVEDFSATSLSVKCKGKFPTEKEYRQLAAALEACSSDIKYGAEGALCIHRPLSAGMNPDASKSLLVSSFLTREPAKKKKAPAKKKATKKKVTKKKATKKKATKKKKTKKV